MKSINTTKIRVSSRALGPRLVVNVYVYDTLTDLRAAATAYNGTDHANSAGVTQVRADKSDRVGSVLIRLARGSLCTEVVGHEMHHAATAWYGSVVSDRVSRRAHLNHYNEPFAYLFSDLLSALVDRLYALGYYDKTSQPPPSAGRTAPVRRASGSAGC